MTERLNPSRCRWRVLLANGMVAIALGVDRAGAALIPSVAQELRGRPLASFESQTLDGRPFSSTDPIGKPAIVNVFASWCPVCWTELKDLPTILTGIRDAGADLAPDSPFQNGLHDRLTHFRSGRKEKPS